MGETDVDQIDQEMHSLQSYTSVLKGRSRFWQEDGEPRGDGVMSIEPGRTPLRAHARTP